MSDKAFEVVADLARAVAGGVELTAQLMGIPANAAAGAAAVAIAALGRDLEEAARGEGMEEQFLETVEAVRARLAEGRADDAATVH